MFTFFKRYFLNFWLWWYAVEARLFLAKLTSIWLFTLEFLNLVPMLSNLFEPLYQDYTRTGRIVGFIFRSGWIFFGSLAQLVITIPLVVAFVVFLILPLLPPWAILSFLINAAV